MSPLSPITIAILLIGIGVFLKGLAAFLEVFRPRK